MICIRKNNEVKAAKFTGELENVIDIVNELGLKYYTFECAGGIGNKFILPYTDGRKKYASKGDWIISKNDDDTIMTEKDFFKMYNEVRKIELHRI